MLCSYPETCWFFDVRPVSVDSKVPGTGELDFENKMIGGKQRSPVRPSLVSFPRDEGTWACRVHTTPWKSQPQRWVCPLLESCRNSWTGRSPLVALALFCSLQTTRRSVLLFKPKYRLAHPENYLFSLSKKIFSGSKYPKKLILSKQTYSFKTADLFFQCWRKRKHCSTE